MLSKIKQILSPLPLEGATIIAAVSGGPDSVALLLALAKLREEMQIERIGIVHLNHLLRGADSDADEQFVFDLFERFANGDPAAFFYHAEKVDIRARAAQAKESIETTARTVRYEWLTTLAQQRQATWIATGHSADDQAETVLHRMIRGAGMKGLRGIPFRRPLASGVEVVRPLLDFSRSDILDFLAEHQQPFREDPSNVDFQFTRNRIRHELLPLLKEHYNPALVSVLCRLARQASEFHQQELELAVSLLQETELPRAGELLIFNAERLRDQNKPALRAMFRAVWDRENWPQQHMGCAEWERVAAVAKGELNAADFPGGIRARRCGLVVQVGVVEDTNSL